MKKVLMIIGGIAIGCILLALVIFGAAYLTSKKLVCKSNEGNITIMYNDSNIVGYTSNGITYDLDNQKAYAERIGIDAYIIEFSNWFSSNTTGSCS